jgi:hypothetical protein
MINRDNYELWFLDYVEGKLDDSGQSDVHAFLAQNPDLQEEFNLLMEGIPMLGSETTELFLKAGLRKKINPVGSIDETNYQTFFIAAQEGDLTNNETRELNLFLAQHAFLKAEFDLFSRLKLIPGNEYYPSKKDLKRSTVIPLFIRFSAAASLIFFLGWAGWRFLYTDTGASSALAFQKQRIEIPLPEPTTGQWVKEDFPKKSTQKSIDQDQEPALKKRRVDMEMVQHKADKPVLVKSTFEPELLTSTDLVYTPVSSDDEALSVAQVFGKLLENGLGKNGVSKRLIQKKTISALDIADTASLPFKKAENPILAISPETDAPKRKVRINLGGFFEAEFAVKK